MRLKPQYVFIIALVAVVILFFLTRALFGGGPEKAEAKAPPVMWPPASRPS